MMHVHSPGSGRIRLWPLCLPLAALLLSVSGNPARAGDSLSRLEDRQAVATIRHESYTIPLQLAPYPVSGTPADTQYTPPPLPASQRSALPPSITKRSKYVSLARIKAADRAKTLKTLPADSNPAAPRLSGFKPLSKEVFFSPPPYLQKMWDEVMARHDPEKVFGKNQKLMNTYRKEQWRNIVDNWRGMSRDKQLRVINGFFNNWPSKSDQQNYGEKEYWASPEEMLRKGSGDCEDYAIIKYLALRYLNWPTEDMWLVLVQDKKKKTHHAVLAARYGSQIFILDNLSKPRYLLIPDETYMKNYMPFYAINERSSWIFAMPQPKRDAGNPLLGEKENLGVAESDEVMKR